MKTYTCITKIRDNHNNIKQYVLEDTTTKQRVTVDKDRLKGEMSKPVPDVYITNLKIDSSGKLVDKANPTPTSNPQRIPSHNITSQEYQELLKYIKGLENTYKEHTLQLKEIADRLNHTKTANADSRIDIIIQQLNNLSQQLNNEDTLQNNQPSLSNQIDTISSYLLANSNNLRQIKDDINNLSNKLQDLTVTANTDNSHVPKLISEDGTFEMPSNCISSKIYSVYFTTSVNPTDIEITNNDILEALKTEIEKAYKAYSETETFYSEQLDNATSSYNQFQLFAALTDMAAEKVKDKIGVDPKVATKALKDFGSNIITLAAPGLEGRERAKKTQRDFGEKSQLSKEEADKIMQEFEGIWNSSTKFIENDEQWEIELYVIQTLNKNYFNTYKVTKKREYNDIIKNDNGKMSFRTDDTSINKWSNRLTEQPLEGYYNNFYNYNTSHDMYHECAKLIYDRFITVYFAAKQVLYKKGIYPFSDTSTPDKNGYLVKLVKTGLILTNLKPELAENEVCTFCNYNAGKKRNSQRININVDINSLT